MSRRFMCSPMGFVLGKMKMCAKQSKIRADDRIRICSAAEAKGQVGTILSTKWMTHLEYAKRRLPFI
ncbi:hypothetical protein P343_06615 [Sporolactobacillus laevolacticus DSM 442]|uniref:Uncharacterized protein n=1 Tax=Sporolactobacillus laevolacticus DSM 442 TaxID=1395513 RepID=V6IYJ8_9BACL|nr:hypothetical protein P343_06615 [Sporolactobacillus laevolacticus DSM 442]